MRKPNKRKNYRRCISCHKIEDRSSFTRVIKNYQDNQISINQGMGRSAYICRQKTCLLSAKKRLSRALKMPIPDDIYQQLWLELSES